MNLSLSHCIFSYHFNTQPNKKVSLLSLISKAWLYLLASFTFSYKNFKGNFFKGNFFKVVIEENGQKFFFTGDIPKFSLYWTWKLLKYSLWAISMLSSNEVATIDLLKQLLPWKLSTRKLLNLHWSSRFEDDFCGMFCCSELSLLISF